jgi:hypothetical protein
MASFFHIELDTTPPTATLGIPFGNEPGSRMRVPYSVDETGVAGAVLQSPDGLSLPMEVLSDELAINLSPDHPSSIGQVVVQTRDELLNQAFFYISAEPEPGIGEAVSRAYSPHQAVSSVLNAVGSAVSYLIKHDAKSGVYGVSETDSNVASTT